MAAGAASIDTAAEGRSNAMAAGAASIDTSACVPTERRRHELLTALRTLPDAMRTVLARRETVAEAAQRYAPTKRYWAAAAPPSNSFIRTFGSASDEPVTSSRALSSGDFAPRTALTIG